MNRNFLFALVVFRIAANSALAAGPFSGLVVFGDSLSDVGNVQQRTTELAPLVQPIPGPYYFNGRFSNGQNYAEVLSQGLGFGPLSRSLAGGNDFAYGDALTTGTTFPNSLVVHDLDDQVNDFLASRTPAASDLFVVFAGANDLLQLIDNNQTDVMPAVNSLRGSLNRLYNSGARDFLVLNIPELGTTPEYNGDPVLSARATGLTVQFNSALNLSLDSFETGSPGATVFRLDVAAVFRDLLATPAAFGFANVTAPAAPGLDPGAQTYDTNQIAANVDGYLFWDTLHPTRATHALLGQRALQAVPEPGSATLVLMGSLWLLSIRQRYRPRMPRSEDCN